MLISFSEKLSGQLIQIFNIFQCTYNFNQNIVKLIKMIKRLKHFEL